MAAESFYRLEQEATANWRTVEVCDDGRISTTLVTVIGGSEIESPNLDEPEEFVTVLIRNTFPCEGDPIVERASGPADFTVSDSLKLASVEGLVTLRSGEQAAISVSWTATGSLETTTNTTQFPGFVGIFKGKEREAVATGSVVVGGENLVNGPSVSGSIETLEDRNLTI